MVLDPAARCSAFGVDVSFSNRQAWVRAQQSSDATKSAAAHLRTGKLPNSKPGQINNEMRFYVKHATLAPDGLLITTGDSQPQDVVGEKNKVIVPHNIVLGLLYHMHNQSLDPHPSMNQLKARFNRTFYMWNLQPILDSIYKDCYICLVVQKQPLVPTVHQSKVQVQHPHRYFLADVIKRSGQCILLVTDHFSNLSQATVVDSEKVVDLKEGLIKLTTPI